MRYWKHAVIAVVAFLVGSGTIATASGLGHFVISNAAGTNAARVGSGGRLLVNAKVRNFPEVQTVQGHVVVDNLQGPLQGRLPPIDVSSIVNLGGFNLERGDADCTAFSYEVPAGKTLLISDVTASPAYLSSRDFGLITQDRGMVLPLRVLDDTVSVHFQTPLPIQEGDVVCPFSIAGGGSIVVNGHLVGGMPSMLTLTGSVIGRSNTTTTANRLMNRVEFQVSLAAGSGEPVEMTDTSVIVTYIDEDQAVNVPATNWSTTWLIGSSIMIYPGEVVEIVVQLSGTSTANPSEVPILNPSLGTSKEFTIQIKPVLSPDLMITRTTPEVLTPVVDMH